MTGLVSSINVAQTLFHHFFMIFKIYLALSALVFLLSIGPLLNDPSGAKARLESWMFLMLAMALGPITLPNMIWSLLRKRFCLDLSPVQYDYRGIPW